MIRAGALAMRSPTSTTAATHPRTGPPDLRWITLYHPGPCPTASGGRTLDIAGARRR